MRGLWRTIAYMAEDKDSFSSRLAAIAGFVTNTGLKDGIQITNGPGKPQVLDLQKQPTQQILQAIDKFLRGIDPTLELTGYELAEVNRITYETRDEVPPHKNLKDYWAGLGAVGTGNRSNTGFMEAVGALAIDGWARSGFAHNTLPLSDWFGVSQSQENDLRGKLVANSASDRAAALYSSKSWPVSCGSVLTIPPDWNHFNL